MVTLAHHVWTEEQSEQQLLSNPTILIFGKHSGSELHRSALVL
jgi:hypothetical protein